MISKEQVSRINSEQVEHIARLARIELTEEEREKFTKELSSILDYFEKLSKVDTSKIEGISQVTGLEDVMREDDAQKIKGSETRNKILEQAPQKKGDYFQVPKILE